MLQSGSRPHWRSCVWGTVASCLLAAGAWGCRSSFLPLPHDLGGVRGEVQVARGREPLADLGPVVVYLGNAGDSARPRSRPLVLADDVAGGDSFGHDLVVINPGEALRFASHSGVAHRLFAVRRDSGLEAAVPEHGESAPLRFDQPGATRFYCSLHQDETWDVFVSPSPHFARVDPHGAYRIDGVPPGDYALSVWSASFGGEVRAVRVGRGISALEPIVLDPARTTP